MKKVGHSLRLLFNSNENNENIKNDHESIPLQQIEQNNSGGPFDPAGRHTTTSGGTTPGTIG